MGKPAVSIEDVIIRRNTPQRPEHSPHSIATTRHLTRESSSERDPIQKRALGSFFFWTPVSSCSKCLSHHTGPQSNALFINSGTHALYVNVCLFRPHHSHFKLMRYVPVCEQVTCPGRPIPGDFSLRQMTCGFFPSQAMVLQRACASKHPLTVRPT